MERLTQSVEIQTQRRGANHGLVSTSDGFVLIDTPFKPSEALQLREEIDRRGPLRYVINTEPHVDHWTGNAYFDAPVIAHVGVRQRILEMSQDQHRERIAALGPNEGRYAASYQRRLPEITYETALTLDVGDRRFELHHMPGHTPYQTAVVIPDQGVVFTSDNLFNGVHTWLQEADPGVLLSTIEALRRLDVEIFVPGHGEVGGREALDRQEAVVREWLDYVQGAVDRGLTRDQAMDELTAMTDRFPMDVEQEGLAPKVMRMNVANLFDYLTRSGIHAGAGAA